MSKSLSVGSRGDSDLRLYCRPVERGSSVFLMSDCDASVRCNINNVKSINRESIRTADRGVIVNEQQ